MGNFHTNCLQTGNDASCLQTGNELKNMTAYFMKPMNIYLYLPSMKCFEYYIRTLPLNCLYGCGLHEFTWFAWVYTSLLVYMSIVLGLLTMHTEAV